MRFREDIKIETDDFFYDLFEGDKIIIEDLLERKEDVLKIKGAIKVLEDFLSTLEEQDLIKYK